ncbi:MAG: TonB-dependent receptor [Rufibacter sp.]
MAPILLTKQFMRLPFRFLLFFCSILFASFSASAQAPADTLFSGSYEQADLQKVLEDIEAKTPVKFYFQKDWVTGVKVTATFTSTPIRAVLQKALAGTTLEALSYHPYAIVIKPAGSVQPVLATKDSQGRPLSRVQIGSPQNAARAPKVTLKGKLTNAKTGEEIVGATVAVASQKEAVMTDASGNYELSLPVGEHLVSYRVVGLLPEERIVGMYSNGSLNIGLHESAVQLNEVRISADRLTDQNVNSVEMGINKLDMQVVRKMPTFMGEADVVKAVMMLPGVSSVGEGSGGFNVRGGSTDQNLVLMGGVPVYNPSHLFGFFSVFNPDAVENVTLYRGGTPAQFGGRLSSVLDVKQKAGNRAKLTGKGGIGPVTSRLALEGPLGSEKTTFLVAGRASYINWFLHRLEDEQLRRSSASFYDITGQVNHEFSPKDKLALGFYFSQDAFGFTRDSLYSWQNLGANLKHTHAFSEKLVGSVSAVLSRYRFSAEDALAVRASTFENGIWSAEVRPEITYYGGKHQITAGIQAAKYELNSGRLTPTTAESSVNGLALPYQQALEAGVYLSDEYTINARWSVMLGLRFSSYWSVGPGEVYTYASGRTKIRRSLEDTLHFASGETIAQYSGLEPRASIKFSLTETSSLKAGYQRMRQYLHLISSTVGISPIDFWQSSNYYIKPQVGDQYSLGYFQNFKDNTLEFSLEGYYKTSENQLDYKEGADLYLNSTLEADLLSGKGRTYGAELLLSKKSGRLTGWASYTYARSLIQVASTDRPEEEISNGEYYSTNYDKPHTFNMVTAWAINRRVTLSSNFTYSTGRPTTAPIGHYEVEGRIVPVFGPRNGARIPDYHRLDLSLTIETNYKKDKKWEGRWNLSVNNVYGRKNAYSVFYRQEKYSPPKAYKLSVIGIPLPSITYDFKF